MGKVDAAISQRAARLLQEERARMTPTLAPGLESAALPVDVEVEEMCASLLEDTQAARASAAGVRQRAVAAAGTHTGSSLDQRSSRTKAPLRVSASDPMDTAISQRAARLLQEERARMTPTLAPGLESAALPVDVEVEEMCASLLEDTQAARASAAGVRQRAVAAAGTHTGSSLDQRSSRTKAPLRVSASDPMDTAISQRAARLLQEERARMTPTLAPGLESAALPVDVEVEEMCASLLEDTQAARASAAGVRQRAVAHTGSCLDQQLFRAPIVAAEAATNQVFTGTQRVAPPALELLSDDSDDDDDDDTAVVDEAYQAMVSGTVLGLCGNGRISDCCFHLLQQSREQGGPAVIWKSPAGGGTAHSAGGYIYLADVSSVLVEDEFCALHLESVHPKLPMLSLQAYHAQDFQHWRIGLQALVHTQYVSNPQLGSRDSIQTDHAHSWMVPLNGQQDFANGANDVEQTRPQVSSNVCSVSTTDGAEQSQPKMSANETGAGSTGLASLRRAVRAVAFAQQVATRKGVEWSWHMIDALDAEEEGDDELEELNEDQDTADEFDVQDRSPPIDSCSKGQSADSEHQSMLVTDDTLKPRVMTFGRELWMNAPWTAAAGGNRREKQPRTHSVARMSDTALVETSELDQLTRTLSAGPSVKKDLRAMVRRRVSKKTRRVRLSGSGAARINKKSLDLSYVTDRIIAMGFPATDFLKGTIQNHMEDVEHFLDSQFGRSYCRVYNLCSEPERDYDRTASFGGNCERFGFPDHSPPTLTLMQAFCDDAAQYLSADPANCIAVHCKAGKGRTGTMIAALLLHLGEFTSAEAALQWFGKQRTHNAKGVTIPSQRRYVAYYEAWLRGSAPSSPLISCSGAIGSSGYGICLLERSEGVLLERIRVHTIPHFDADNGCDPYYIIKIAVPGDDRCDTTEEVANMKTAQNGMVKNQAAGGVDYFDLDCMSVGVQGSVKVSKFQMSDLNCVKPEMLTARDLSISYNVPSCSR